MPKFLFNFKKEFAPRVKAGAKCQTIRQHRKDGKRPAVGDTVCLYAGLRTAKADLLREAPVVRCRNLRIDIKSREVIVDGDRLTGETLTSFYQADGFDSLDAFVGFFRQQYATDVFEGFCIEWAPPFELSEDDINNLRHMLGAEPGRYKKANWGFRNYYSTGGAGSTHERLLRMESLGLLVKRVASERTVFFHATEAGCLAVGLKKAQIRRALED